MAEKYSYEIDGRTYIQKPLVLGQIRQMMKLLEGVVIPSGVDTLGLISVLGDKLPLAIAIVLTPEDVNLKDKDIQSLAPELEFEMPPELAIQVIEDFFDCNPLPSLLERLAGMAEKITSQMKRRNGTGLKNSSASSEAEISQKETVSSGASA